MICDKIIHIQTSQAGQVMSSDHIDKNSIDTVYIRDEISRCESIPELKEKILPLLKSQQEQWKGKIAEIISETGCTKDQFSAKCGVTRQTVYKWCKGAIPRSRELFIRIGLAAGYDLERMNQLLMRYGRYPALYSKSLTDCVCIYVLEHFKGEDLPEKYSEILNKISKYIIETAPGTEDVATKHFDEKLSEVGSEDELDVFIKENIAVFSMAYNSLYSSILATISANYTDNEYELAESQGWSSSLRQCVSRINKNKWNPTRNKIISLGLHLSMDHDQIDELLEKAHMEPLYARNIFESIIMFILDDAELNNMLDEDTENYDPDALCRYAKRVFEELDIPETDFFISEISEIDDAR